MPVRIDDAKLKVEVARMAQAGTFLSAAGVDRHLNTKFPGMYEKVAPDRDGRVQAAKTALARPFTNPAPYSFEYWYTYFFNEIPESRRAEFAGYVLKDDGSPCREYDSPQPSLPPLTWRAIFDEMLSLGFSRFPATDHLHTLFNVYAGPKRAARAPVAPPVVFRGDSRDPDKVREQKGSARQSEVAELRNQRNMNKPWHPFRDKGHFLYLRKVQADNCLFTVLSVTPKFDIATKFPLLYQVPASARGAAFVLPDPAAPPRAAAPPHLQRLNARRFDIRDPIGRQLVATKTHVYCMRPNDLYDTQKYQVSKFDEYASESIHWADHLVWFEVVRIHYSDTDGEGGHLIVVTNHKWLQHKLVIANMLGRDYAGRLEREVGEIVDRCSLRFDGRGGVPHVPAGGGSPFRIDSVTEWSIPDVRDFLRSPPAPSPPAPPG